MAKGTSEQLDSVDFALGVLNAATEHYPNLILNSRNRYVDQAFEDALHHLSKLMDSGEVADIQPTFFIRTHPIHGDSETVFSAMCTLASLQHIQKLEGPGLQHHYAFRRSKHRTAEEFHREHKIPGSIDTYRKLAGRFIAIVHGEIIAPLE